MGLFKLFQKKDSEKEAESKFLLFDKSSDHPSSFWDEEDIDDEEEDDYDIDYEFELESKNNVKKETK